MYDLVYGNPIYNGANDAAKASMGKRYGAILWREKFPPEIQAHLLVSTNNPTGSITNSDLELAAMIAQSLILEEAGYPMAGESMHNFCNNTPRTVAWQTKGSTTTIKVTADLLQHTTLHQQKTGHIQ
jgi:hypothetical protein